jgi:nitrous oxidase accessory protein NosD
VQNRKFLTILGTNYPKVDGFYFQEGGGGGTINGFSIQKTGVSLDYGQGVIRNNYFYNCGIDIWGGPSGGSTVMNNQIAGGTINLYDTGGITITGNTVSKSKCGLYIGDLMRAPLPTVSKNTFKNCNYGVYIYSDIGDPGQLTTFSGNKYSGNKVNIGWGTKYF